MDMENGKVDVTIDGKVLSGAASREFLRSHKRLALRLSFDMWRMVTLARVACAAAWLFGLGRPKSIIFWNGFEWHDKKGE